VETAQDLRELWVLLHVVCFGGHRRVVVSRDLGLLNGNRSLSFLLRFSSSVENYLIRYRLRWGKADTLSKLPSRLSPSVVTAEKDDIGTEKTPLLASGLPPIPPDIKPYFTANIPLQLVSIIRNDWPYSGACTCLRLLYIH